MADAVKTFGGKWRVVDGPLGRGGQGVVYKVARGGDQHDDQAALARLREALISAVGASDQATLYDGPGAVVQALRDFFPDRPPAFGAAKELLPFDSAINASTAIERMKNELDALKAVSHPSLVRVLDDDLAQRWFVMEYFERGTLAKQLALYRGRPLEALLAFRPLVDAVGVLHQREVVHRDIKPENVFVADDGSLVLGDFGLAIKLEVQDRITDTYENVGSRDWMPAWAYGQRLDQVRPTFDVFSLGKLLWAMLSGKPRLRLWYIERPEWDLRVVFPDVPAMHLVHRTLLRNAVVEDEEQCGFQNAHEMLLAVDSLIETLRAGGIVPTRKRPMRCRFCAIGTYEQQGQFNNTGFPDPSDRRYYYRCANCGHLESFYFRKDQPPPGWIDES